MTMPSNETLPPNDNALADVETPVIPAASITQAPSTPSTPCIQPQNYDTPPVTPLHPMFDIPPSPDVIRMLLPPASPGPSLATPIASTADAGAGIHIPSKRKEPTNNSEDDAGDGADAIRPSSAPKAKKRKTAKSGVKKAIKTPARIRLSLSTSGPTTTSLSATPIAPPNRRSRASAPTTALVSSAALLPSLLATASAPAARRSRPSKTNNVPTTSTPVTLAAASSTAKPNWFTTSLLMMGEKGLGSTWLKLVEAWATFEENAGYEEVKKLPAANRPEAVKAWIQQARSPSWRPSVTDIKSYETEYMLWWAMLQPAWRRSNTGSIIFSKVDGDWESLRRPGLNGLLSVMVGLLFWGITLRENKGDRKTWNKAVSDCLLVITCLS